ncbi:MAG: hypothetical protein JNK67_16010 [Alphaproteobacteria bacterium]|nr:hypothetical protein [Alphaproteobacteria bacterium]
MDPSSSLAVVDVRYYERDGSVFLDTHYLIKGVAGAIFWKLARESMGNRRSEFSLRELRLAGSELRLPEFHDNLSVRLLLLQRRLAERGAAMQIHKAGRGRFRFDVQRPLRLTGVPDPNRKHAMASRAALSIGAETSPGLVSLTPRAAAASDGRGAEM